MSVPDVNAEASSAPAVGAAATAPHGSEPATGALQTTVIRPSRGWIALNLRDLWSYRELLYFFVWRDIKVRYKQTILGGLWAVIQPFFLMVVFSLFFGKLAKVPSDGVPYPIFAYVALVPWTFFAHGLTEASGSLVHHSSLVKKIYFPRLVIPTAAVLSGVVDFGFAFVVLLGLMAYYDIYPTINALYVPALILLALTTSLGVGLWLSALNVQFRDVRYTLTFLVQFWMFATPITYPSSLLPEPWRSVYGLNPMAGVVEGFRWALLDTPRPGRMIWMSVAVALLLMITGAVYFRRMERTFADTI